jgi:hypothetical protein
MEHHWFAGLFDADGTITFSLLLPGGELGSSQQPQLTISATSKLAENVNHFSEVLGGYISYDKAQKGYWKWSVQSRSDVLRVLDYFRTCPSYSAKRNRILLVKQYHALVDQRAYRSPLGTPAGQAWRNFLSRWQY